MEMRAIWLGKMANLGFFLRERSGRRGKQVDARNITVRIANRENDRKVRDGVTRGGRERVKLTNAVPATAACIEDSFSSSNGRYFCSPTQQFSGQQPLKDAVKLENCRFAQLSIQSNSEAVLAMDVRWCT